jgi:hypothetical protein
MAVIELGPIDCDGALHPLASPFVAVSPEKVFDPLRLRPHFSDRCHDASRTMGTSYEALSCAHLHLRLGRDCRKRGAHSRSLGGGSAPERATGPWRIKVEDPPGGRAAGLGSARRGVDEWRMERVTALAVLPLTLWLIVSLVALGSADRTAFVSWLGRKRRLGSTRPIDLHRHGPPDAGRARPDRDASCSSAMTCVIVSGRLTRVTCNPHLWPSSAIAPLRFAVAIASVCRTAASDAFGASRARL